MKILIKEFIVLISFFASKIIANVALGIDIGSDHFKMNILKPGRPMLMVENLQSKTNTPTGVTFKDDERLYSFETLINKSKDGKQTLNFIDRFLGEKYKDESVENYIKEHFTAYETLEDDDRKTYNFKLKFRGEDLIVSPEEHFGMLFRYMKMLAEKYSASRVYDVYVAVPNCWGYKKRQALSQAVRLANLELKGLVTQNTAAAVHWMSDKSFNETSHFIFYNMGSSYTQATLVTLLSKYETDKKNVTTENREINILAETWDDKLGGRDFNKRIVDLLFEMHDESDQKKGKPPTKGNLKIAEKIIPHSIKIKEILSANKQSVVNILGIESGMNLKGILTKEDFDKRSSDLLSKVYDPIERLLNMTGLSEDNITAIELIGGGVRAPEVIETIKRKLGNKVGMHMNGDDSVAFGTTYMFANSTKASRTKKRVFANAGAAYEIKIDISSYLDKTKYVEPCNDTPDTINFECLRTINKNTTLFKIRHGNDITRTVSFKHFSDMKVLLKERKEGSEYDPNYIEQELMTFYVTGYDDIIPSLKSDNLTIVPKTHLKFKSSEAGLISLTAELTYEVDLYFTKVKGENDTIEFKYLPEFIQPITEKEIEEETEKLKAEGRNETDSIFTKIKSIGKKKKSEKKHDLKVERLYTLPRPLNKTEFDASKKKLDSLDELDILRLKNMEARNNLETDLYAKREFMEGDVAKTYSTEEERKNITDTLQTIYNWYEEDGYNANTTSLISNHNEVKSAIRDLEKRIEKHEKLKDAVYEYEKDIEKMKLNITALLEEREWLKEPYEQSFSIEFNKVEVWYAEKKSEQKDKALTENPVFTSDQVITKLKTLQRQFRTWKDTPKPKPVIEEPVQKPNKEELEELLKKMQGNENGGFDNLADKDKAKFEELFVNF